MVARKKSRKTQEKKTLRPKSLGWNTSDEDEIALRIKRGEKESLTIKLANGGSEAFADRSVSGKSGETHRVEIRSAQKSILSLA